jgi:flagellar biosynthesis/type III secretory pathway protein FliH
VEKELVISLFDKRNENAKDFEGWVPLDSGSADKMTTNEDAPPAASIPGDENFSPLYTNTVDIDAQKSFNAIFSEDPPAEEKNDKKISAPDNTIVSGIPKENEKKAYEDGFSKGEKEGYEEGKKRAEEMIKSMEEILAKLEDLWPKMTSEYEDKIMQLVYRAAEKVVYGHIDIDNEVVKRSILNAFELIPKPLDVTININPADYEFIETAKEDLFNKIKQIKRISIVSNPSVGRGGCLVESKDGDADSTIEKRLESIKESIIAAAEKSQNRNPL